MSFQIDANQPLQAEIRRLMQAEIDGISANLATNEERAVSIHEARKRIKKLRSILRFVRDSLKPKFYQRENARYRDVGRALASARDNFVIYETLDLLRPHLTDRTTLNALRRHYSRVYRQEQASISEDSDLDNAETIAEVQTLLDQATHRLSKLKLPDDGFAVLLPNLMNTYRQGQISYKQANKKGRADDFHEWRKNVKYLWHQVRLLAPTWQTMLEVFATELKHLGDLLGVAHDFMTMEDALLQMQDDYDVLPLVEISSQERQRLETQALQLGARIYAEEPASFAMRFKAYWDIHVSTHSDDNASDS